MAPTPYTPSGQLDIIYTVSGLEHRIQYPVDIVFSGGAWNAVSHRAGGTDLDVPTLAQDVWTLIRPFYTNAVGAASFLLQQRDVNIFIPVENGSLSGVGSGSGVLQLGTQATFTFRDVNQFLARHQFAETIFPSPDRATRAAATGAIDAYWDAFDTPAAGDPGDYIVSRADHVMQRGLFLTTASNRKIRRARGLV